jgi:predicted metal-binding membrane protein
MALFVAVGVMSIPWTAAVAVVVLAQELLPVRAVLDVPVSLALVGLGIWILTAPTTVPGLLPPM